VLQRYEWQYVHQRERQAEAAGSLLQLGPTLQPPASQRPLTDAERAFAKEYLQLDLLYQGELACQAPPACFDSPASRYPGISQVEFRHVTPARPLAHCHLNGGVLLLRSAAFAEAVIRREPQLDRASLAAIGSLDQDEADGLLRAAGARDSTAPTGTVVDDSAEGHQSYRSCHLPSDRFVGFCSWAWGYKRGNRSMFDQLRPCQLATYHAHCLLQPFEKLESMQRMLDKTAHCQHEHAAGERLADSRLQSGDRPTARKSTGAHTRDSRRGNSEVLGKWGPKAPGGPGRG